MSSEYTFLVMGNPLLDILVDAKDDSLLKKYGLKANDAILSEEKHKSLYEELVADHDVKYVAGGAGQNTARGVQHILPPRSTVYIGCVGEDDFSVQQKKSAEADGVRTEYLVDKEHATGKCAVVCFAAQRSLVADLSAANHYKISHLESEPIWKLVENAKYFYIASFFLTVSVPSLLKVAEHACNANKVFCMNLSAPFLCQFFKDPMDQALPYVDILFGNESEAEAYSESHNLGTKDIKEIAMHLYNIPKKNKKRSRLVVVTQGANATIVVQDGKITEFSTPHIAKEDIVDTNGAGDSMAAGFLGHYIKGDSVAACVAAGHLLAGEVIRTSGCVYSKKAV